jgi:FKBP-type peptidyl-prolyl cis-trans isomerase FkpA
MLRFDQTAGYSLRRLSGTFFMHFSALLRGVVVSGSLAVIVGCPSPAKVSEHEDSFTAEANTVLPVTFTDKELLQSGTGVMDDDAPKEFQQTESGLKYRVLRKSDGRHPTAQDTVTVNYRGWLDSGKEFDSSYKRGEPISFPLNGVIPGWTEGMQLIGEGGMIELWIPSRLGYGAEGSPGSVPPNATLHFIVELISVS